jgi:uncharacterized protein (TIGR02271 family)
MQNTIIAVYDSFDQAQRAVDELLAAGFTPANVQLNPHADSTGVARASSVAEQTGHTGSGIGHFFRSLFGMEDEEEHRAHHDMYAEAIRRGSSMLTVNADRDDQRETAIEIMNRFGPVDMDKRISDWRREGWTEYDAAAPAYSTGDAEKERSRYGAQLPAVADTQAAGAESREESQTMPVVEEQLKVGKRTVQRDGVRVFRRVTEQPARESVDLRKEHVGVERQRVDRPAGKADMAAFKEGSIELREMSEEPVVSKEARVVEEVEVGRKVSHETANIDEKLRRSDVEVEQLGASHAPRRSDVDDTYTASDDADFRTHWENAYGKSGGRYEDYDAAYRYGSSIGGSERFKNYSWEDAEPQMRNDWESRHPESKWEKVKDAVRHGAEKATGRRSGGR